MTISVLGFLSVQLTLFLSVLSEVQQTVEALKNSRAARRDGEGDARGQSQGSNPFLQGKETKLDYCIVVA